MRSTLLILFTFLSISCSSDPETYTVDVIDGVRHVHNLAPLWGNEPKIKLEFIRKYGGIEATDPNLQFYNPVDLDVDNEGNLYVLDSGNFRVQKFNSSGIYVETFGEKGQGPGEFESVEGISLNKNGNIYVYNNIRGIIFDPKGKEINRFIKQGRRLHNLDLDKKGNLVIALYSAIYREKEHLVGIFDNKLNFIKGIGTKRNYTEGTNDWLYNVANFTSDEENNYILSYCSLNRIEKYNEDGSLLWRSDRPLRFEPDNTNPPDIGLKVGTDYRNRIWAVTFNREIKESEGRKGETESDIASYHLFDPDGVFLGEVLANDISFFSDYSSCEVHDRRVFIISSKDMSISEYNIIEK